MGTIGLPPLVAWVPVLTLSLKRPPDGGAAVVRLAAHHAHQVERPSPATAWQRGVHKRGTAFLPDGRVSTGPAAARVNLNELAARVAGYNLALRGVEAELAAKGTWNADRLAPLAARLQFLASRRRDLELIRGLLPDAEQAVLVQAEPLRAAVAQLARRIVEARSRTAGADFPGDPSDRDAELKVLEALSTTLAEIVADR